MNNDFIWTDELVMQFSNEKFWDFRSIDCFKERVIEEMRKQKLLDEENSIKNEVGEEGKIVSK